MNGPVPCTVACEDRDFIEWHGGSAHAVVWAVEADTDQVRGAVSSARAHWGDVLLPRHQRQPHITLAYAGPLAAPGAQPVDEPYTALRLAGDLARLTSLGMGPFRVAVGGWGTFPMVPFLRASAPELHALNAALMAGSAYDGGYVPHVTIGHYGVSRPLAEVTARAARWAAPSVDPIDVTAVTLLAYETHDIAGPLAVVGRLSLADQAWSSAASFAGLTD